MTMRSRLLLLPALLLSLTACDGPFEIKSGETPGDPFAGADFGSPTRPEAIYLGSSAARQLGSSAA